jgi:hypothetical protein
MTRLQHSLRRLTLVAFLVTAPVTTASAQTPAKPGPAARSDDQTANADRAAAVFTEGKAAAKRNDWQTAYRLFQESWILNASFDTAANIGFSALKVKKHAEAARYLSYAIRHFPTTGDRAKRNELTRLLGVAKNQVTTVTLVVEPTSAEILVNGTPRTDQADPLFLDPGQHTIEARATGYESEKQTLTTTAGAERDLKIALKQSMAPAALTAAPPPAPATTAPPAPLDSTPAPAPDTAGSGRSLVPAIVAGGVAVIGLAAGIGFTLTANSKESEADDIRKASNTLSLCAVQSPPADCARLRDLEESEDQMSTFAAAGFVAGGVGAAVALGYLLWPQDRSTAALRVKPRLEAMPAVSTRGAGLFVSTRF